jgi:DNA-binding transcriptional regulator YiaG
MSERSVADLQRDLGLSDGKLAIALGVTRQTVRNWRCGRKCPQFAQQAMNWMMELRRLDPANDNLPQGVRVKL